MKLIVGLGNPGSKYDGTRHNVGFMVIDALSAYHRIPLSQKGKFKGELGQGAIGNETVLLLKPQTFMNLSGESVLSVKQFYNIKEQDILVVYDDLDLDCGKIRIRQKGSAGGHNGIKSIIGCINSQNFHRLKIGIGRDPRIQGADYVLGKFTKEQKESIATSINLGVDIVSDWLNQDITYVMNKYN